MHWSLNDLLAQHEYRIKELTAAGHGRRRIASTLSQETGRICREDVVRRALARIAKEKLSGVSASGPRTRMAISNVSEVKPEDGELSVEEIIASRVQASQRKHLKSSAHAQTLELEPEPFGIMVFGDPHVDNDGCDWAMLMEHVKLVQDTPGVLAACVGDMQDNWIGRLQKLYANTSMLASEGWRLSQWFLESMQWIALCGGNHDCHSADTEVLTRRGWLAFPDVADNDEVLGLTAAGVAEWQSIERRVAYPYSGPLHRIETSQISAAVTPNHRVLYKAHRVVDGVKGWTELRYDTPENIRGRISIPVSGVCNNVGTEHTDAQLRVAAWILTDGCMYQPDRGTLRVTIYQRESNADAVRADLDAAGISYTVQTRTRDITSVCGRELKKPPEPEVSFRLPASEVRRVMDLLRLHSKSEFPAWTSELSEAQFHVFLDGLVAGDGTWTKSRRAAAFYGRKPFVEALQALCVMYGYSASIYTDSRGQFRLNICRRAEAQMEWRDWTEDYVGDVHCLTVPLSNFAVRRNGKAHFSGNSWAHAPGHDPLRWLSKAAKVECYADDEIRITLTWKGRGDLAPIEWLIRHDFAGRSWFHPTHGPNKEAMLDGRAHLFTAGHIHSWGMLETEQRHERVTRALRVRGYKRDDDYARAHGFAEQTYGESALIVIDPTAPEPGRILVFWDLQRGCEYLTWLRSTQRSVA